MVGEPSRKDSGSRRSATGGAGDPEALPEEIEVKLRLAVPPAEARRQLQAAGASLSAERVFEENVLYDDGSYSLARRGRLLRLRLSWQDRTSAGRTPAERSAAAGLLTLKEFPRGTMERYKVRGEIETPVGDPEALDTILRRLGFAPVYTYQKYRTAFHATGLEIALDETPVGNYLELEGSPEAIDAFAGMLGYRPEDYITLSYRGLQEAALAGTGREPGDLLFHEE